MNYWYEFNRAATIKWLIKKTLFIILKKLISASQIEYFLLFSIKIIVKWISLQFELTKYNYKDNTLDFEELGWTFSSIFSHFIYQTTILFSMFYITWQSVYNMIFTIVYYYTAAFQSIWFYSVFVFYTFAAGLFYFFHL